MNRKKYLRRFFYLIIIFTVCLLLVKPCVNLFRKYEKAKVANMNAKETVKYYAKGRDGLKLTVGILYNGEMYYKVYDENGDEITKKQYDYEIASITKTFTTGILAKAVYEGKINLDESAGKYLGISDNEYFPSFLKLATHTSGIGGNTFNLSTLDKISYFYKGYNELSGYSQDDIISQYESKKITNKEYSWDYSDLGMALLGNALSNYYGIDYETLVTEYISKDLGLVNTKISHGTEGNLDRYWKWDKNDGYMPAAGLISTVTDLLRYGQINMTNELPYLDICHKVYATISDENNMKIGLGWMIDKENNIIWHNGRSGSYTSFLGYDSSNQIVVVVLSNRAKLSDTMFLRRKTYLSVDQIAYKIFDEIRESKDSLNLIEE